MNEFWVRTRTRTLEGRCCVVQMSFSFTCQYSFSNASSSRLIGLSPGAQHRGAGKGAGQDMGYGVHSAGSRSQHSVGRQPGWYKFVAVLPAGCCHVQPAAGLVLGVARL
jgi:hypothetical protein